MADHWRNFTRRRFMIGSCAAAASVASAANFSVATLAQTLFDERYELSIHQYSLKNLFDEGKLSTAQYAAFVKEQFGFANVEFAVEFCEVLRQDPAQANALAKRSQELGVRHRALLCGAEPALDSADEGVRRAAVKDHLEWAEVAKRLGCDFIRVRASTEGEREKQLDFATQGISALCDALADSPLTVLVENVAGFSRDPDWLVSLVKRVGEERLGLIADFGNFEGDLYAGMERLLPYTKSVCTKSWKFDEQGNETTIDFGKMMAVIQRSAFRGCIAIEYLGETPIMGVKQTADLLRRVA